MKSLDVRVRGAAAIESAFDGRKALISYLVAGYPTPEASLENMKAALDAGSDVLEVGVPFSDPIADGPVIQTAQDRALAGGMTLVKTLTLVRELRTVSAKPALLMSYCNPIMRMGIERFVDESIAHGVDGVIVPDLIPDEAWPLIEVSRKRGFATVFLAAPNSSHDRLKLVAKSSSGFIYAVGLEGVTGEREAMESTIPKFVSRLRSSCAQGGCSKIAVGFGVSTPEHFKELSACADGVIVGSALVRRSAESPSAVGAFVKSLNDAR